MTHELDKNGLFLVDGRGWHLRSESDVVRQSYFDDKNVDSCKQKLKWRNLCLKIKCERTKRTLFCTTQTAIEIDPLRGRLGCGFSSFLPIEKLDGLAASL